MEHKQQIAWLNGAKFIAILAVMIDHTSNVLYTNQNIACASYFSVSLFIILSGMTSYLSDLRHAENGVCWWRGILRSCKNIGVAYCIAVIIYMIVMEHAFAFPAYLYYLVNFNISGPHYFVLLYIQLMVVNKFLFNILQKCPKSIKGYIYETLIMAGIIVLSIWTTNHTNILNVYGGGGKLFGGTYLILYFFGMLVMRHGWLEATTLIKSTSAVIVPGVIWFIVWRYTCSNGLKLDTYLPFGDGYNPPSITFMTFGLCMLFMMFGFFTLLEQIECLKKILLFICGIGRHSLYIFLYHRLLLDYFLLKYMTSLLDVNRWLARIVFFVVMIAGSVLIEIGIDYIQKLIKWVYNRESEGENICQNM